MGSGFSQFLDLDLALDPVMGQMVMEWEEILQPWVGGLPSASRVLDLGCGRGKLYHRLVSRFPRTVGLDIEREEMEKAPRPFRSGFFHGDARYLPFPDGTFDLVMLREVIEHVVDSRRAVEEVARVLKRGGTLVLTTPSNMERSLLARLGLLGEFNRRVHHVRNGYSAEELRVLLRPLEVRDICYKHVGLGRWMWELSALVTPTRFLWLPLWRAAHRFDARFVRRPAERGLGIVIRAIRP